MKALIRVFKLMGTKLVMLNTIFTLVWSALNIGYIRMLSLLTVDVANGNYSKLPKLIVLYFIYLLLWELVEFIADIVMLTSSVKAENTLSLRFLKQVFLLKPGIIKKNNTGYINGLAEKYIQKSIEAFQWTTAMAPISSLYILYATIRMWMFHWIYGMALIVAVLFSVVFSALLRVKAEKYGEQLTENESQRSKRFIDTVSNIGTVQKMNSIDYMWAKLEEETIKCKKSAFKFAYVNEIGFAGYKLMVYLYLPVVCLLYYLFPETLENPVEMFSFLAVIAVQLVHMAKDLANIFMSVVKLKASTSKVDSVINDDNTRANIFEMHAFDSVEITDVEYSYYNKDKEITTTVKIPKLVVNKGDTICIYGESGQGKTTTLNILSGEIETGHVKINGMATDKRLDCVYIAQDNSVMDMTLRENLTLGADISDAEIMDLIDKCGLSEWLSRQKNGLDIQLGERGVFISTGQRQRLNLIRGLLVSDKEIYLLDEPTSNVDDYTEERMIEVIQERLKDKTVVIVTHRPKIKAICNKAYKFENGILGNVEILETENS